MTIRLGLAPLAAGLLAAGLAACGGAGHTTGGSTSSGAGSGATSTTASPTSTSGSPRTGAYDLQDGDNDPDDGRTPGQNDEESLFPTYGRKASPADARTIATLVKSYLAAAAAGDGAKACSLLDATLARELVAAGSNESCATVLPALFKRQRPQLTASDVATMTVISVHVKGNAGLAELGFRTLPEQELIVERKGSTWKIDAPLGNYMP